MNKRNMTISKYRTRDELISSIYNGQKVNSRERKHKPPNYTKAQLKEWLYNKTNFTELYLNWLDSGRLLGLIPSVDRLSNQKGYSFDNIQLITWDENEKLARKVTMKPVLQYNIKGVLIDTYDSANSAERSNPDISGISSVASGKRKSAGGYIWIYKEDFSKEELTKRINDVLNKKNDPKPKAVLQFSLDGVFINRFSSILNAGKSIGDISGSMVTTVLRGNRLSTGNSIWIYEDNYDVDLLNKKVDEISGRINNGQPRPVMQFTPDGKHMVTYNSVKLASEASGIPEYKMIRIAAMEQCGSEYIWLYKDLYNMKNIQQVISVYKNTITAKKTCWIHNDKIIIHNDPKQLLVYYNENSGSSLTISGLYYALKNKNNKQLYYLKDAKYYRK